MKPRVTFITVTLILLSTFGYCVESIAPAIANYNVNISSTGADVNITGSLLQGIPRPPAVNTSFTFGTIPVFKFHLEGDNASFFVDIVSKALQAKTPTASATNLLLDGDSNGTQFHYTLSFRVNGIASNQAGSNIIDLSWRSFAIAQNVKVGNNTVNAMVKDYLGARIITLSQLPPSETFPVQRVRRWYWDDHLIRPLSAGSLAATGLMFNFSSLNLPLTSWNRPTAVAGANGIQFQSRTGFNLTYAETITEIDSSATFNTNVVYDLTTTINAPWGTIASKDSLNLETGWGIWLMLGAIVATAGLLAGTFVVERKFLQSRSNRPKNQTRK